MVRRRSRRRLLKAVKYQRGKSITSADRTRRAIKPGKRRSRKGKIYWETRKNRSDLKKRI